MPTHSEQHRRFAASPAKSQKYRNAASKPSFVGPELEPWLERNPATAQQTPSSFCPEEDVREKRLLAVR